MEQLTPATAGVERHGKTGRGSAREGRAVASWEAACALTTPPDPNFVRRAEWSGCRASTFRSDGAICRVRPAYGKGTRFGGVFGARERIHDAAVMKVQVKVEHPIEIIKSVFGFSKARTIRTRIGNSCEYLTRNMPIWQEEREADARIQPNDHTLSPSRR